MSNIAIYDKPMCCSTGICGPEVDPVLPRFAADLEWLRTQGHGVERHNLAQQPAAFAENETIKKMLSEESVECLPVVIIDGQVVSKAVYPSREQFVAWAVGKSKSVSLPVSGQGDCCGPGCC